MSALHPYDAAVVGGGPAGSSAALALARHGLKVALLEKEPLPRYKTCGGGVVRRALRLLPTDIGVVVERRCARATFHLLDAGLRFTVARQRALVWMTMRDRLDHLLVASAARAGAELVAPCHVCNVVPEGPAVRLDTDRGPLKARFVVAADGALSELARRAGWPDGRRLVPALECEVGVDDELLERFAAEPRFDIGPVPYGYAWVFPKASHLSIGVLSTRRGAQNLRRHLDRYLETVGIHHAQSVERHGFVIPTRPRPGPFVKNRVLLAGDAAGLADPVTAEGITFAVRSGQLAADAILRGEGDEGRVRRAYHTALRNEILPELRLGRGLARLLYDHPRLRTILFRRAGQRLMEAFVEVFAGERTYQETLGRFVRRLRPRLGR